jgi:DNA mismatch repair protein MutS
LEQGDRTGKTAPKTIIDDLPLFSAVRDTPPQSAKPAPALQALSDINPDDLTPKQALDELYRLRALLDQK